MSSPADKRPTIEDVAELAGTSRATASRVVNGSEKVAAATREAVLRAVETLNYVPNPAARSLMTRRTDLYAFVLPEAETRVFSDDPFFPSIVRSVSVELESVGKQLVLMLASTETSLNRIERHATSGHVDGVIMASMHGRSHTPLTLLQAGVPIVISGKPAGASDVPYVDVDHQSGVEEAVTYLVESGKRKIATIAGPQDMVAGTERLAGYRSVMERAGRAPIEAFGDFTRESGAQAMRDLLRDHEGLDAVFVASDLMAVAAIGVIHKAGLRVPEDVAVIGFDDIDLAQSFDPPLTTVRQRIDDIGKHLAKNVVAFAEGRDFPRETTLPTDLVRRESA